MSDALKVSLGDGTLRIAVELPMSRGGAETVARLGRGIADDAAAVNWQGRQFTFTRKQRSVVQALRQARDEGREFVAQETLLELAGSDQLRLRELFRDRNGTHPAWGTMIRPGHECGGPLGTYCLVEEGERNDLDF